MSTIRFLSGPLAGKIIKLKKGQNTLGRAPHCDITIASNNISKEHACIEVYDDKIILSDSGSRNGTFVNGIQIQNHKVRKGDKLAFFDVLAEVGNFKVPDKKSQKINYTYPTNTRTQPVESYHGNVAYDQNADRQFEGEPVYKNESPAPQTQPVNNIWGYITKYLDEVVLPGVYKLIEWMEFRSVLILFVGAFIVLVTSLSTIPLIRILRSSIELEAQNRALTIARALARDNRSAIMQNQPSLISIENARIEPGVDRAYVISSASGEILAPTQMAGQYVTDVPYINQARKHNEESVTQIDSDTIAAVAPVKFYNPNTGSNTVSAHTVIVYNMGTLSVSDGKTLSLFIQVLFIAFLAGGLLFFFLYKVVLRPIVALNENIDLALRGKQSQVSTIYLFPEIQQLASNINSAISRSGGGFASDQLQMSEPDRMSEMQSLANLVGFAAITVSVPDRTITFTNQHFLNQIGSGSDWSHQSIDQVLDQALKLNIHGLIDRIITDPTSMVTDQLEISNQNYDISAQGIMGAKSIAYILIVFIPKMAGDQ